jgi:hypothetical protein
MRTINVEVVDWNQSRRATLPEVPCDITVGELLASLADAMALSEDTRHYLIHDGQRLNNHQTLEDLDIDDGAEMTVAPEVVAG